MLSSLDTVLDLGDDTLLWPGEVPHLLLPAPCFTWRQSLPRLSIS